MIKLKFANVQYTDDGCISYFPDGKFWGATPHQERHYYVISHRTGYGDDVMAYCREHELAHHLVCEWLYDSPSPILWKLAHGEETPPQYAAFEEIAAMTLQRWVRANERPIVGGVDWDGLKARFLEVVQ